MNKKYDKFVAIPVEFFLRAHMFSANEFRLIAALIKFTSNKPSQPDAWWKCNPSVNILARMLDVNPVTVNRLVRQLKPKGLVVKRYGVVFNPVTGQFRAPCNSYDLQPLIERLRTVTDADRQENELVKDMTADQRYEFYKNLRKTQKELEPTEVDDLDFSS